MPQNRRPGSRMVLAAMLSLALAGACATSGPPPLQAMDRSFELERFMGDWYVIGFIPISIPFFSEANAHNGVESYRLADDGIIETTYTFRDGAFDGPRRQFTPRAWVPDPSRPAAWRIQFLWPFRSDYLVLHLEPDYQTTIVGVPSRSFVWIMSRRPEMSDARYAELIALAASFGYDTDAIRRVPQRWPAD